MQGERNFLSPLLTPLEKSSIVLPISRPTKKTIGNPMQSVCVVIQYPRRCDRLSGATLADLAAFESTTISGTCIDSSFNTAISFVTNTNWQAMPVKAP